MPPYPPPKQVYPPVWKAWFDKGVLYCESYVPVYRSPKMVRFSGRIEAFGYRLTVKPHLVDETKEAALRRLLKSCQGVRDTAGKIFTESDQQVIKLKMELKEL